MGTEDQKYTVKVSKKAKKSIKSCPTLIKRKFHLLMVELKSKGPYRKNWPNYSPLGEVTFHCHLSDSWVAVWRFIKGEIKITVEYVGSREDAPY